MEKHFDSLPKDRQDQLMAFDRLLTIMDELREKCPWDRKQTLESLRHLTIEETYELSDAIIENDLPEIRKELGDIMLHLVFYAKIASEPLPNKTYQFDIQDVLNGVCDKLISRHPHIYGDAVADSEEAVKQNWEKLKLKEGNKSVLSGVPASLPALVKAMRIQEKARGAGFDWDEKQQVWEKVQEELEEFKQNFDIETGNAIDQREAEGEFGDLLFSLVNYSRFVDINPETALERTNKKFIRRFQYLEEASKADGKSLSDMTLSEMDTYWNKAKELGV
ncbi:Nucleoside triphosphate pyrophosphohydrolase [Dyadobacter sp. CECT 9623]|uniref:Nucleoside triphosphate pyrophosphohydrolase n=1 Tax=Dyadobacter linearis TaxID=2823330 RepID=A0ABN7R7L0_9BACT|nr:nucleoside triphosphate pyrophosphohydrolase [Dyadobacter sp. CECT 9623]CAG5070050.1 Nucleoside triphosphate pyrophosphohydrolase [Dyadobacter sp. CECT 9623]